jgi:hypothetical protein
MFRVSSFVQAPNRSDVSSLVLGYFVINLPYQLTYKKTKRIQEFSLGLMAKESLFNLIARYSRRLIRVGSGQLKQDPSSLAVPVGISSRLRTYLSLAIHGLGRYLLSKSTFPIICVYVGKSVGR